MLPTVATSSVAIYLTLFVATVVYSLLKGGGPERAGGVIMLYTFVLQGGHYFITQPEFLDVDPASLLVDIIMLIGFGAIAMSADRKWPLFATALVLLALGVGHFGRFVAPEIFSYAYALSKTTPTWMILLLLVFGTRRHQTRIRRLGADSDWVDFKLWADLKRFPNNSAEFFSDLRSARARSWLEEPTIVTGVLVLTYTALLALAAVTGFENTQFSVLGVALLLALGGGALVIGRKMKKREEQAANERLNSFREKYQLPELFEIEPAEVKNLIVHLQ